MTTDPPRQLVLDLGVRPALGVEDFMVGQSNLAALALIDQWPDWPVGSAMVVGATGSGKTHLANVWRVRSGALSISAATLAEDEMTTLVDAPALVVEDIDQGIGCETSLFHLLNLARQQRTSLLLTARCAPGELEVTLPDLRSRLRALPLAVIEPPDEGMLRGVLVKLFADRQLAVEPAVVETLASHMERTMAAATRLVDEIDRLSLASRRKVTRALAHEVLSRGSADAQDDESAA